MFQNLKNPLVKNQCTPKRTRLGQINKSKNSSSTDEDFGGLTQWPLDAEVSGLVPGRTNLGNEVFLIWVF